MFYLTISSAPRRQILEVDEPVCGGQRGIQLAGFRHYVNHLIRSLSARIFSATGRISH